MPVPEAELRAAPLVRSALRAMTAAGVTGAFAAALTAESRLTSVSDLRREVYVRAWAPWMLAAVNVQVLLPRPLPPWEDTPGGRLVVSNHRSMVDVLLLLSAFGGHLLSRDDLGRWPLVGTLARMAGTLFVDRKSAASGATAVRQLLERLRQGRTLGVFPEGTTFPDDPVRPFHPGAFLAVLRTQGWVQPVGLAYEHPHAVYFQEPFGTHARRVLQAPVTRVSLAVGEGFRAEGTTRALAARAEREVAGLVTDARRSLARGVR